MTPTLFLLGSVLSFALPYGLWLVWLRSLSLES